MIDTVYATTTFPAEAPNGARVMVHKGTHWPADDPLVDKYPTSFSRDCRFGLQYTQEPAGWGDPPVEQATAAPGERRSVRRVQHNS